MSIERLERVMWRLRNLKKEHPTNDELRRAIMYACGTDDRTYYMNRKALVKLGWIRTYNSQRITLTDVDLTQT